MLELLYSSGLRLSELAGVDVDRIDLERGEIRVWGKGQKERIVPVGAPAQARDSRVARAARGDYRARSARAFHRANRRSG